MGCLQRSPQAYNDVAEHLMLLRRGATIVLLQMLCATVALAQTRLMFEAVSVKENATGPGARGSMNFRQPDRITATNIGLETLVRFTFDAKLSKITGLPEWAQSARFDINAKSEKTTTIAEKREMLRALLEDRFGLKHHIEVSDGDVYALTVKSPGELGPFVRPTSPECASVLEEQERNGYTQRVCTHALSKVPGNFEFTAMRMQSLGDALAIFLQKPIVDRTNLAGRFDIVLQAQTSLDAAADDPRGYPSIFTALQEQAGLKLESVRGPIQTFVVDAVERPTPD